jgi:peptidyl-prolyl cis-trans isomerase C/peptidyl-prolyl cis-trans isomerase D
MHLRSLIFFWSVVVATHSIAVEIPIVATVGKKNITLQEFKQKYDEVKKQAVNAPAPDVFLEDLVRYEMGVQEAEKQHLQEDPFVREQTRQAMYKLLIEKALADKVNQIKVTEGEMRKFYEKNPEIRSAHILIEIRAGASADDRAVALKRAKEIYEEVKKSHRPFEELVKLYSDDTLSKNNGGDIGYQSRVTLVPQYYETVVKMKLNEISPLIETRYGYHIVKLLGRRTFDQANRRQIRASVFDEKRKDLFDAFFSKLRKNYKIELHTAALKGTD